MLKAHYTVRCITSLGQAKQSKPATTATHVRVCSHYRVAVPCRQTAPKMLASAECADFDLQHRSVHAMCCASPNPTHLPCALHHTYSCSYNCTYTHSHAAAYQCNGANPSDTACRVCLYAQPPTTHSLRPMLDVDDPLVAAAAQLTSKVRPNSR